MERSCGAGCGPAGAGPAGPAGRGPGREARSCVADAALLALARAFARGYLELEAGRRGHRQLAVLTAGRLRADLAGVAVRGGTVPALGKLVGMRTSADRFDAVALVQRGARTGALVVRLSCTHGTWRVVDAGRPEARPA